MHKLSFSQASLEDYRTCPRRFQLRYLHAQKWPALVATPPDTYEDHRRQGVLLHRMIQQHELGFPASFLTSANREEPLATWYQRYLDYPPDDLPAERIPEFECSSRVEDYHLVGKFDLLAYEPGGRFVIVDWKTDRRPPSITKAAERMQTHIYPYLLVESGAFLNEEAPIRSSQVEMVYWYAEDPQGVQRFSYTEAMHAENRAYLLALMDEISQEGSSGFPLTDNLQACVFCTFRSLCGRGSSPGSFDNLTRDLDELDPEPTDSAAEWMGLEV
jgi:CRISPR/Cas system-associated exonuclease Cas4 (RecB family)